jgi:hypothetical protein
MLTRRLLLAAPLAFAATEAACTTPAAAQRVTIYKASSCTCCEGWVRHMQRAGFTTVVTAVDDVSTIWRRHHVPDALSSCHLGLVGGYVVVGHVPPADVRRLLTQRPRAIGITVPGMPFGSPGMENPDVPRESFQTLLMLPGGGTRVFASHPA